MTRSEFGTISAYAESNLAYANVVELRALLRDGKTSATEVQEHCLRTLLSLCWTAMGQTPSLPAPFG